MQPPHPLVRPSTHACRDRTVGAAFCRTCRFRQLAWLDWGEPDKISVRIRRAALDTESRCVNVEVAVRSMQKRPRTMPALPPLQWSQAMEDLHYEHVLRKVVRDNRTDLSGNVRLGFPFDVIRDEVIRKGRADFRVGHQHNKHGELTSDEKGL